MGDLIGATSDTAALHHFLDAQRNSVLAILDGLSDRQLMQSVPPLSWTPLGLIEHLAFAERYWFQEVASGAPAPLPQPYAGVTDDGSLTTTRSPDVVFAFYRLQIGLSDQFIARTPLHTPPLALGAGLPDWSGRWEEAADLRWIILHMIEETARHAGHLDTARELIDGEVGLGPR